MKKNISFIYSHLFCCNHMCYCICMVSVTSAPHNVTSVSDSQVITCVFKAVPRCIRNFMELAESVPIGLPMECPSKTLIRLPRYTVWSESLMDAHASWYHLLCPCSNKEESSVLSLLWNPKGNSSKHFYWHLLFLICIAINYLGNFACIFVICWFLSASTFFLNILSGMHLTVLIQIRPNILSGLIWIQTVCKGYQQQH